MSKIIIIRKATALKTCGSCERFSGCTACCEEGGFLASESSPCQRIDKFKPRQSSQSPSRPRP